MSTTNEEPQNDLAALVKPDIIEVNSDGMIIFSISISKLNDPKIVLAVVKKNGLALRYASDEMKNNHDIVVPAVCQNGNYL